MLQKSVQKLHKATIGMLDFIVFWQKSIKRDVLCLKMRILVAKMDTNKFFTTYIWAYDY